MSFIWRPNLPESNDGDPLAKTVADLLWNFPYHRLPASPSIIHWSMRPEVVMLLVVIYLTSKRPLKFLIQKTNFNPRSSLFRSWIAFHNSVLALYSGITVVYTWPIVVEHLLEHGLYNTYCDPEKTLWHSGFGAWALIFYISKYYEFVDTWILVLKVRTSLRK
jgi:GNS1/SUR4 family